MDSCAGVTNIQAPVIPYTPSSFPRSTSPLSFPRSVGREVSEPEVFASLRYLRDSDPKHCQITRSPSPTTIFGNDGQIKTPGHRRTLGSKNKKICTMHRSNDACIIPLLSTPTVIPAVCWAGGKRARSVFASLRYLRDSDPGYIQ